jgi:hypothetical protein
MTVLSPWSEEWSKHIPIERKMLDAVLKNSHS